MLALLVCRDLQHMVMQHQRGHDGKLATFIRVCSAVVHDRDSRRYPIHRAQMFDASANDVNPLKLWSNTCQILCRQVPRHEHFSITHLLGKVVDIPIDGHVQMLRNVRM